MAVSRGGGLTGLGASCARLPQDARKERLKLFRSLFAGASMKAQESVTLICFLLIMDDFVKGQGFLSGQSQV